jgi:acyl-CoA thioesterase-1
MSSASIETWVQYIHLDKLYGYLPGMADVLPAIFGLSKGEYDDIRARFGEQARAAARDLLTDSAFAAKVDALPFQSGQTVVAVGDSLTDDLRSWAEILRHALEQRRPGLRVRVINEGLSAHTTTMVLRRWPATVATTRPDWVLCALGGNDVTRVGPEPTTPQVETATSMANLRRMQAIAPHARWVWITPAPVREERIAAYPPFRFGGSTWRNTDICALADALRGLDGPLIDLLVTFGVPADPALQGADGLHPTLAGQAAIVRTLVECCSGLSSASRARSPH